MANTQINITENGTTTLATNGCICDKDIDVIVNVPQDGAIPETLFSLSGECSYRFYKGGWNTFLNTYKDRITTSGIQDATSMFEMNSITDIPFDLNFAKSNNVCTKMFYSTSSLKEFPTIRGAKFHHIDQMFRRAYQMRYLPTFEDIDFSRINTYAYCNLSQWVANCYSLRSIDENFLKQIVGCQSSASNTIYNGTFEENYSLDELRGLPMVTSNMTSNMFNSNTFSKCYRLKNIIFDTNEDGTAKTARWYGQVIDLTKDVGYTNNNSSIFVTNFYNSGITADKEVTDDATYQALKDDPDWWTKNVAYSRYNHDSAVNTINSLPDTSAYLTETGNKYTNTIKFLGASGSATDGGAINTLTEEEIAVATAKGWTVTLV